MRTSPLCARAADQSLKSALTPLPSHPELAHTGRGLQHRTCICSMPSTVAGKVHTTPARRAESNQEQRHKSTASISCTCRNLDLVVAHYLHSLRGAFPSLLPSHHPPIPPTPDFNPPSCLPGFPPPHVFVAWLMPSSTDDIPRSLSPKFTQEATQGLA